MSDHDYDVFTSDASVGGTTAGVGGRLRAAAERLRKGREAPATSAERGEESPILAFQTWCERFVKDRGKPLTQDEYFLAQQAFYAAHPGKGPTSSLMAPPPAPPAGVESQLEHLKTLPVGWDGYRAPQIDHQAIARAVAFLRSASIVPCAGGGVQLEWHQLDLDLEIEFEPDGTASGLLEFPAAKADLAPPAPSSEGLIAMENDARVLAREIGNVMSVAERRFDPDGDHRQMLRRLADWRTRLHKLDDALTAAAQHEAYKEKELARAYAGWNNEQTARIEAEATLSAQARQIKTLTRERDEAKRWLNDAGRSYAPCVEHQPDAWEGDGTCVICEGHALKARADAAESQLSTAREQLGTLRKYAKHQAECPREWVRGDHDPYLYLPCRCGLTEVMAALALPSPAGGAK